jgi:outer membrane receptor protein involved in Fe transport
MKMPSRSGDSRNVLRRRRAKRAGSLRPTPLSAAIAAALASAAVPAIVAAQDPEETLEVFVVTATRRAEDVQDVPINIAMFNSDLLEEREISDLAELGRNVPGLYVVDQGKRTSNQIVVRGLNLDSISSAEGIGNNGGGTVSTYIGDIPLYVDFALNDMDRVEVLLGPQGTLYGAGTLGGAIRYIPRDPELDTTSFQFRATSFDLGESDGYGVRGGVTANFPLGDELALRASVDYYDDPGFIDTPYLVRESGVSDPEPDFTNAADVAANLYAAEDVNSEETISGRVALLWAPTAMVDGTLTYYYQNMDVGGRTQNHSFSFGTPEFVSATRYPEPNERQNELVALEISADLGFAELTSATGVAWYNELGQRDQTDLLITLEFSYEAFPSFSAFTRETQDDRYLTQELRLVSQGAGKFSWIGGLFYSDADANGTSSEFTPHYDEYLFNIGFGTALRPDSLEYYSVLYEQLEEQALFGEITYQFTDRWQVTLGGRWYDYTYKTESGAATPLFSTVVGDIGPNETGLATERNSQQDDGFLYKINTSFDFSDDLMAYLTISEGYRIGSANGVAPCPVPLPPGQIVCALPDEFQYFPDKTTNHEIGMRSRWVDGKVTFNASLYYIEWEDPQLGSATANGAQPITKNGQGAETKGFELSVDALLTDRFSVGLSYADTNAELSDPAPDLLRMFTPPGFGPSGTSAIYADGSPGDRLSGSPDHQATLNFGYDMPVGGAWTLDLNYGIAEIGSVLTKVGGRAGGEELGGYTVHSASAMFRGGKWSVGGYVQNLTDESAVTGVRSIRDFAQTVFDENGEPVRVRSYANEMLRPREVGIRFTYDVDL